MGGLCEGDYIDFAYLTRRAQKEIIFAVATDQRHAEALLCANPDVAAAIRGDSESVCALIAPNAAAVQEAFSAEQTGGQLTDALCQLMTTSPGEVTGLPTFSRVLNRFLALERFHPLRLEETDVCATRAIIRRRSSELLPRPTELQPQLQPFDLEAILFDIYGTLLISASGDVGAADTGMTAAEHRVAAFGEAWRSAGLRASTAVSKGPHLLVEEILNDHETARGNGNDFPEVDIIEIWRKVVQQILDSPVVTDAQLKQLATEYETSVNPVWPMPGLMETLGELRERGLIFGIVSNAQFFTPAHFPCAVGSNVGRVGVPTQPLVLFVPTRSSEAGVSYV